MKIRQIECNGKITDNEHVIYEFEMMKFNYIMLSDGSVMQQSLFNAFHESYWIHINNLINFFDIEELKDYTRKVEEQIITLDTNKRSLPISTDRLLSPNSYVYDILIDKIKVIVQE